jgi:hypothetical protein
MFWHFLEILLLQFRVPMRTFFMHMGCLLLYYSWLLCPGALFLRLENIDSLIGSCIHIRASTFSM